MDNIGSIPNTRSMPGAPRATLTTFYREGMQDDDETVSLLGSRHPASSTGSRRKWEWVHLRRTVLAIVVCGAILLNNEWRPAPPPPPPPPPHPPPPPPPDVGPPPTISLAPFRWVLNESLPWAEESVPAFESADADVTLAYWYRWRLFHLHMRRDARGPRCEKPGCWVITEFLRKVFWSGPHNTIVCPAGHHIMEGRWLRDLRVVDDYARFWFAPDMAKRGFVKQYTFWGVYALWQRSLVTSSSPSLGVTAELFGELVGNYRSWMRTHYSDQYRCMFTSCHADGEENSAGLDGCRPTINSVMFGEAVALRHIALALGNASLADHFAAEASRWQRVLTSLLWDDQLGFFVNLAVPPPRSLHAEIRRHHRLGRGREVQTYFGCLACHRPRTCPPERGWPIGKRVRVRELMGLSSPWYFGAVPRGPEAAKYALAFAQLDDPRGFGAKWGPTTTERRSPCFNFSNSAQCNWNGPVWPFETSKVGTAMINLLQAYPPQPTATRAHFDRLITTYARAHTKSDPGFGRKPPHVDEDLHPDDGYWIVRRKLHGVSPWPRTGGLGNPRDPLRDRGTHYFHSSYVDLVLSGVVGLRPLAGCLELAPLSLTPWFAASRLRMRGVDIAVVWDADGSHYAHGAGLHVWLGGRHVGSARPGVACVPGDSRVCAPRVRVAWDGSRLVTCRSRSPTAGEAAAGDAATPWDAC